MDVTTLEAELNKIISDVNLQIEEVHLQHQEKLRFIDKWVQEAERSWKGANSKCNADPMKRPLSRVFAEESVDPPVRPSRSAAKAAATKIRSAVEAENESSKKRRCIVKIERISVPQSVLDVIDEEQEINNISGEVKPSLVRLEMPCATVYDTPDSDFQPTSCTDEAGKLPSADNQSPFQSNVPADSTFTGDAVHQGTVKCNVPDISDKGNRDSANLTDSVQDNCSSDNFVIPARNADSSISGKVMEDIRFDAFSMMPEGHTVNLKGNKTKPSQAKLPVRKGLKENEEVYSNLQKLITESPVRVTRTKTRAFAQAAAAAAISTNDRENVQEPVTKKILPENVARIKYSKKKLKTTNKKEVSGLSNAIMSPTFQKHPNKTTPEDNMKENYLSVEKTIKETAVKDLNSAYRLKTPLSANNTLSSNFQSSKLPMGVVVSHCETFITKNVTKPGINQMNQKLVDDSKHIEEKVTEAEKKKERLLKEKAEQQRRNNEARAAKVAKTREQLERQRVIQQQQQEREKEQRLRIAQQKREEEMALKRQLAHQRAAEAEERRKQDEEQYFQALKKKEQEETERKALLLKKEVEEQLKLKEAEKNKKEIKAKPHASDKKVAQPANGVYSTNDIYSGEESEDEETTMKKVFASWTAANRARVQLCYQKACAQLVAQLYQFKPDTPDLLEIFGTVPDKALVRTSSAVWNSPPCNKTLN